MNTYQDLLVWQKAHKLVLQIYRLSRKFPASELYGLTSQLRRAAVSVPANIVEGFVRKGDKEFARFLVIAQGSLAEVGYLLLLSRDWNYVSPAEYARLETDTAEVGRMLHGLLAKVRPKRTVSRVRK